MPELYYVCSVCSHTVSAPEIPERCEYCGASYPVLRAYYTLDEAEHDSQDVLDTEQRAAEGLSATALHARASGAA